MPRLPAPEDYGLSTPRPTRGVTENTAVQVRPDLATGKLMQDIGALMQAEAEKFDDLVAEDAMNKLREKRIEMTYGQNGFTNVRGAQITTRPVMQEFPDAFNREVEGIAAGLNSSRARIKFQQAAGRESNGYKTDLMRHVAGEVNTYAGQVHQGKIGTLAGTAATAIDDPIKLEYTMAQVGKAVADEAARLGYSGPVLELFKQTEFGKVHDGVIKSLINSGRAKDASEYLVAAKGRGELAQNQFEQYANTIKGKRDWEIGNDLAAKASAMRAEGKSLPEIEAFLAAQTKDNKEAYSAAQAVWTQRQAADQMAAQEQQGGFAKQFWLKPTRATMNSILQSTEFLSLPMSAQGKITEQMVKGLEHEDAVARARRSEAYNTPEAFGTFLNVMSSPDLARMSEDALWGLSPVIGPQNVSRLLAEQKQQQSATKSFRIDQKIVDATMPEEILGKGTKNKDMRQAFNGIVQVELSDWKARNPGKIPTEHDQASILRSATREYAVNRKFWFDTTVKAYELKEMPQDFETQATAALRSRGLPVTPSAIRELWAKQPEARR